jgi:hypothetical protein
MVADNTGNRLNQQGVERKDNFILINASVVVGDA